MVVPIVMVSVVGMVAGRWGGVRGRPGWISVALLLAAVLVWFVTEGIISAFGAHGPAELTRGEWTAMWRAVQQSLWIGLVVASLVVLVKPSRGQGTAPVQTADSDHSSRGAQS